MTKLLNGKINEHGVIVPFNDIFERVYNKAEDSLLYRTYKSGKVEAELRLAEFSDGQVACSSDVMTSYSGYGCPMSLKDKMNREDAIEKETAKIVGFLKGVIESSDSYATPSLKRDCQKVIGMIQQSEVPTLF